MEEHPAAVELLWWGKSLSGVRVTLEALGPDGASLLAELLKQAHHLRSKPR